MFEWDREFAVWLNRFAGQSWTFDQSVYILATNSEFKGYVVAGVLLWLWFQNGGDREDRRKKILSLLTGCIAAVLLGRLLQINLPHIPRPKNDPNLDFILPYGVEAESLTGWSAFPSDHATLFFGAAIGLIGISRFLGVLVLIYVSIVIGFGRIYIGYHFPSDILGGALLGGLIVLTFLSSSMVSRVGAPLLAFKKSCPRIFYCGFLFLIYQTAILFVHLRDLAGWLFSWVEGLF